MNLQPRPDIVTPSLVQAVVNAIINGVISYFMLRGEVAHAITADSITQGSDTVIGHSVFTAMILAVVFTIMGFRSHRGRYPDVTRGAIAWMAAKNAIYAFGLVVIAGVLWQRAFPDVLVGTVTAASIAGLIAGAVSGITNYSTLSRLLERTR